MGMGFCEAKKGNYPQADILLTKSINLNPTFIEAYIDLAQVVLKLCDIPRAYRLFQSALSLDTNKNYTEIIQKQLKDLESTITEHHSGTNLETYIKNEEIFNQGIEAMENKKYQEAIEFFKEVITTDSFHYQSYGNIGTLYALLGHSEEAKEYLKKSLEIYPQYKFAKMNLKILEESDEKDLSKLTLKISDSNLDQ